MTRTKPPAANGLRRMYGLPSKTIGPFRRADRIGDQHRAAGLLVRETSFARRHQPITVAHVTGLHQHEGDARGLGVGGELAPTHS